MRLSLAPANFKDICFQPCIAVAAGLGGSSVAIDHLLGFRISLQTSEIIIPLTARPPSWKGKRSFKNYQKERGHLSS